MRSITIPLSVPQDILITLNQNETELKNQFQLNIAMMLFQQGKLTIGKAIQLSGTDRYDFEKALVKNNIPLVNTSMEQAFSDAEKLKNI